MTRLDILTTAEMPPATLEETRLLMDTAFEGDFSDDDWAHALGGWHVVGRADGGVVVHASVVPRRLEVGGRPIEAGYVEAVATHPDRRREGLGTATMEEVARIVRREHEAGFLSTDSPAFYERLGWRRWRGPTYVRATDRLIRTSDEDDGILVLTVDGHELSLAAPLACEAREGDDW